MSSTKQLGLVSKTKSTPACCGTVADKPAPAPAILPMSLDLLRAVRGHSVEGQGDSGARLISTIALEFAELHAAELHRNEFPNEFPNVDFESEPDRRAHLRDSLDALLSRSLPQLARPDRNALRSVVEQIAYVSAEFVRSLRRYGGLDPRVHALCTHAAILADHYQALADAALRQQPWTPTIDQE